MDEAVRELIGVGVGPGEPELITIKALRALESADVILVPTTEARSDRMGRAEEIVLDQLPQQRDAIRRVPFSMAQKRGIGARRAGAWRASAQAAIDAFARGARTVAFATVGDPSVYSTFSYLSAVVCAEHPETVVRVIPGITAMQAMAAASRTPLCEGQEILALVPATVGAQRLAGILDTADTVTIYKGGRMLSDVRATLGGRPAILGSDIGCPTQRLERLDEVDAAPYFSAILCPASRETTGGRL